MRPEWSNYIFFNLALRQDQNLARLKLDPQVSLQREASPLSIFFPQLGYRQVTLSSKWRRRQLEGPAKKRKSRFIPVNGTFEKLWTRSFHTRLLHRTISCTFKPSRGLFHSLSHSPTPKAALFPNFSRSLMKGRTWLVAFMRKWVTSYPNTNCYWIDHKIDMD